MGVRPLSSSSSLTNSFRRFKHSKELKKLLPNRTKQVIASSTNFRLYLSEDLRMLQNRSTIFGFCFSECRKEPFSASSLSSSSLSYYPASLLFLLILEISSTMKFRCFSSRLLVFYNILKTSTFRSWSAVSDQNFFKSSSSRILCIARFLNISAEATTN